MKKGTITIIVVSVLVLAVGITAAAIQIFRPQQYSVALITDSAGVDDHSFFQSIHEGAKEVCKMRNVRYKYYVAEADDDLTETMQKAINKGSNVIIVGGYAFVEPLKKLVPENKDIKFIAIDIASSDFSETNEVPENLYCSTYREEHSGYLAGYAAVKLGYRKLGFIGGEQDKPVVNFGLGYIKGVNDAAKELKAEVRLDYAYAGQYLPNEKIEVFADKLYKNGTQVVFSCGGEIFTSVCEAAKENKGKIIGVDIDQSKYIDSKYGKGMTVTSALKGMQRDVKNILLALFDGIFSEYAGKPDMRLGIVRCNPEYDYVGLPSTTQWSDKFTEEDYNALVKELFDGKKTVDIESVKILTDLADSILLVEHADIIE